MSKFKAMGQTLTGAGQAWSTKIGERFIKVGAYKRADGTNVKGHRRTAPPTTPGTPEHDAKMRSDEKWHKAKVATGSAAVSGVTTLVLALEAGFAILTMVFVLITALTTVVAAKASAKAGEAQKATRSGAASRTGRGKATAGTRRAPQSRTGTRRR